MPKRRLRGGGLLLQGHGQPRASRNLHRLLRDERECVRLARPAAHRPAARAVLGGRGVVDDILGIVVRLREVRDGRRELHFTRAVHGERQVLLRRVVARLVPDHVALRVERHHAEALKPLARLGAVPHHDALQRPRLLEVHFPPRIVLRLGVRHRAFVILTIGLAINGPRRRRPHVSAALLRLALERDVLAAAEDLDLRELKELVLRRQLDAHKARDRSLALGGRQDARAHPGQDEIPARLPWAFARQLVTRQRLDAQRGQLLRLGQGQLHGEIVLRRVVLGDEHGAVVLGHQCGAGSCLGRARLRGVPVQLHGKRLRPLVRARDDFGGRGLELGFHRRELRFPVGLLLALRVGVEAQERRFVALVGVLRVVEEGEELVILLLRDGVILVRVALGAGHRGAHPDSKGRVHAVHDGGDAPFLVIGAALVVRHRVAMERRALELLVGRLLQQVGGELLDGELVKRQVAVESVDDVVAVGPDDPRRIVRVTGAVRVARKVQPQPRPMLAVAGLRQLQVHETLVSLRLLVRDERVHLRDTRRQTGQVQRHATGQRVTVGLRLRKQAVLREPLENEGVDGIADCRLPIADLRNGRPHGLLVGPVSCELRAGFNPRGQQLHLARRDLLAQLGRRHHVIGIGGGDALEEQTLLRLAGHDHAAAIAEVREHALRRVHAQPDALLAALALGGVRSVAMEALVGKNRADVPLEVRHGGGGRRRGHSPPAHGAE